MWLFTPAIWAGNYFQGVSPGNVFWPGGVVPYLFDTNYTITSTQKSVIVAGLREWELAANVKFVPYTNQTNYVLLQYTNDGSGSGFCLLGTPATMMLHGLARGLMCHEGGHLLGLQHEHQRTDRANYIVINTNNIIGGTNGEAAFDVDTNSTAFGLYDFESVMHYYPNNFSIGPGYDSLDPLPPYQKYYHKIGNPALSIGDRAAVAHLYGLPATPLTNVVTTTADGGPGSLRAAIYYANDHPGTTTRFNIPNTDPNYSNGVFTIYLIGEPPPLVSPGTVIDGTTQPGYASHPIIVLDGSQVSPEAGSVSGLHLYGTNGTVRALAIDNFNYAGVQLFCSDAVSNRVEGCYLGVKPDGTNAGPDFYGGVVFEFGAHDNFIGSTNTNLCNVISGNTQQGILLSDTNTTGNAILGSYIGTDASGSRAVANGAGVHVHTGAWAVTVGGINPGARNVISGNINDGIVFEGTSNCVVQGNYIGTDATGSYAVTNGRAGVEAFGGGFGFTIGGTNADGSGRNVISGDVAGGIVLNAVSNSVIQGNYIGLNAAGNAAVPGSLAGIYIWNGAQAITIGGTNADGSERNVISGNNGDAIDLNGAVNIQVKGNYIGTDASGNFAVTNTGIGISAFSGGSNLTLGGTNAAQRNIISGNTNCGIVLNAVSNSVIWGNYIGLNAGGTAATPGSGGGIYIWNGSQAIMIGGTNAAMRNLISGNNNDAVDLNGAANIAIQGNYIGTDISGGVAVTNHGNGISIFNGGSGFTIGGSSAASRNIVAANTGDGIDLNGTANSLIQGNYVGVASNGLMALPNGWVGISGFGGLHHNLIGGTAPGAGNVISANPYAGIVISGTGSTSNTVQGNFVGTDSTGKTALPNGSIGVGVWGGATSNAIGGTIVGAANLISGNGSYGLLVADPNTSGNLVEGNRIGTDITGTNALGNGFASVGLQNGATGNFIGGVAPGAGNIIAFAGGPGVVMYDASTTNNSIRGNSIFGNGALGIDLNNDGVTLNDAGDADTGPNNFQNFPVITNAFGCATSTIILGRLNSAASRSFFIDIYRNLAADPSGYGEGQFYVGSVNVTTDGTGNALFALTNNSGNYAGQYFTATATSVGGDTSEFGADMPATNQPVPSSQFTGPLVWRTNGFVLTLMFATNFTYLLQATTNLGANPVVWTDLTNYVATNSSLVFTDRTAANYRARFYRTVSP